ncbi:MAG TPA: hypothetical protein PK677_00700 [Acidiphilium sp.]|nr:MAG: hypothetical protein B7Z67_03645 [Acidiphilium sp. 21-60-14]OYV91172.1 MAG: hypothetical protein B7Z57_05940 [Acidiphilium sp. 37-60-79]OZB39882.1 MAG: hypothetical protein B7X48_07485 [Acidiphilium sp. 34-60-192]HQT87053.1 hypothetical protein [Acidiphilium sp.]HQU22900.1 hypothetical protein [Acidiphilium sp.]
MQSALERELNGLATRVRITLRGHDRGIILAFLLCLAPLPPVMLLGALLMLVHALLLALGRLERREALPIILGLLIAGAYTWLWVHIAVAIEHAGPLQALRHLFDHLFGITPPRRRPGVDTVAYVLWNHRP